MEQYIYNESVLCYKIIGDGFPVLLIHGWGMDHHIMSGCMEPIFESLTNVQYKRIYIDLPGMGESIPGPGMKNSDTIIELLLAFMNEVCQQQPFLLMGESYGGYLSRGIVHKVPDRVAGLILLCPLVVPGYRKGKVESLIVKEKDEKFLDTLSEVERTSFEYLNVKLTEQVWNRFQTDILYGLKKQNVEYLEHELEGEFSFDVDSLKNPYKRPGLIITAKQDTEVGYLDQFKLLSLYTEASYVVLNRAGHNLQIEQPEIFTHLVSDWLKDNEDEIFFPYR